MQNVISIFRLALALVTCGSLVSCSLFRPKENDDDTWGDPHWKMDGTDQTQAENSARGTHSPDEKRSRLIGSSRNSDYWPTTEELENRGGHLSMADYERNEELALESFGSSLSSANEPTLEPEGGNFALSEPELPMPADDVDPLAGFWDEEDHSDGSIQRAGGPQDDPLIADASDVDISEERVNDVSPAPEEPEGEAAPPVLMPIPPSPQPPRTGGSTIGSSQSPSSNLVPRMSKTSHSLPPEVVLLDAETMVTDSAFDDVSLLSNEQPEPGAVRHQSSILDRRQRLSLTDLDPSSDGPLARPSITAPREGVAGNP